jgi:uncharacterized membrane protein YphA (DoxX/SURF4 family)
MTPQSPAVANLVRLLQSGPLLLVIVMLVALAAWRSIAPDARPPLAIYGLRFFLGFIFVFSGLAKLIPGFPNTIGPPWLESRLEPYGLGLFARFVALAELAVGLLLLTRRFATLGALMLFPMLTGILVVTISLKWRGTPYVNTVFLLMNAALLAYDYPKLRWIVSDEAPSFANPSAFGPRVGFDLLWLAAFGVILLALGLSRPLGPGTVAGFLSVAAVLGLILAEWRR